MENAEQVFVQKKRKSPRYNSRARAYIIDILEDAIVKDISITGCCLTSEKHVKLKLRSMYVLHIVPEDNRLGKFELLVESRWIRAKGDSNEIGFWVISSPMLFSQYKHLCHKRPVKSKPAKQAP
ncbi:MAG: PilZ domain-containing protein [Treponema sp.]|jgi:hypothetical protein|nr:PilZ domain-containing protein [Treponema sp.]